MDVDSDGRLDLLSGSWPGQVHWFQGKTEGTFAAPMMLSDGNGKSVNVGLASSVNAVDWDRDGDADLLIGTIDGKVHWVPNLNPIQVEFGKAELVELNDSRGEISDAAPVAADWDGDGDLDLLLGADDGSVHWFENIGVRENPQFAQGECLLPPSPVQWGGDHRRNPGDWGLRVRLHATDWNGDGRLDLLMGDYCGGFQSKPTQTEKEIKEELRTVQELPKLQQEWSQSFQEYRRLAKVPGDSSPETKKRRDALMERVKLLKVRISAAQQIVFKYQPQQQSHGFVWLITRRAQP